MPPKKPANKKPVRKAAKKKQPKKKRLPRYPPEGTILGHVRVGGKEEGWWEEIAWDPWDCFVPVKR